MRLTRFRLFLLGGGSLLLLGPAIVLGQFQGPPGGFQPGQAPGGFQPGGMQIQFQGGQPGGFQGRPGGRMGGRGGFDPNMLFTMLSGGKDYIDVATYLPMAERRDPNAKQTLDDFMQRNGITNGQLTRDQFSQLIQERMAARPPRGGPNGAGGPNGQNPADPGATPGANPDDGSDEPPPPEDKRPTIYRAGSLPQGLPTWYAALDTDRDGQIGLYEWKAAGRSVSDFQTYDLNGDGFITMEEALRVQKAQGVLVADAGANGAPSYGMPQFGQTQQAYPGVNGFNGGQRGQRGNRGGNRGNWQGGPQQGGPPGGYQRGNRGQQNPYGN